MRGGGESLRHSFIRRDEVAERIRGICRNRQQAYWVCPLIEESDKLQAQAALVTHEALGQLLPELTIELIHGRMKSAGKEAIMARFHRGDINLLVATTVIEVGVDVPAGKLAKECLGILRDTNDGFVIANKDLKQPADKVGATPFFC